MSKVKMPKPKAILTLSWEDIHAKAEELGHRLSRSQIIDIEQGMCNPLFAIQTVRQQWLF